MKWLNTRLRVYIHHIICLTFWVTFWGSSQKQEALTNGFQLLSYCWYVTELSIAFSHTIQAIPCCSRWKSITDTPTLTANIKMGHLHFTKYVVLFENPGVLAKFFYHIWLESDSLSSNKLYCPQKRHYPFKFWYHWFCNLHLNTTVLNVWTQHELAQVKYRCVL